MSGDRLNPSLEELIRWHGEKEFRRLIDVRWPHSQSAFIERLYEILDEVVCRLEEDADVHHKSTEEAISRIIVRQLQQAGYSAHAESHNRGHVDISVSSNDGKWRWLGESKIHRKYKDLSEALIQLLSRYSTGRDPDGGCLILVQNENCNSVLAKWREWLQSQKTERLERTEDGTPRCFWSVHRHDSAAEYRVRHIAVHLHYKPRDKSARARKR